MAIWKQSHIPEPSIPNPTEGHGWTVDSGSMQPLWTDELVLPQELGDILEDSIQEAADVSEDEDEDEDIENGFYSDSDDDSGSDSDSD